MAVEENGPADQAGLQEEDVIVALGDEPASNVDDLHKLLMRLPVGIPATVTLLRKDRRLERMVVPAEYPSPTPQE
jgi:S1-C subfamily serine protease